MGTSTHGNTSVPFQDSGYAFGQGENSNGVGQRPGAGGGWYGGYIGTFAASGGSGYIGNSLLTSSYSVTKHMACHNCKTSSDASTMTIANTCHSGTPTADCSKEGNGYAKVTLVHIVNTDSTLKSLTVQNHTLSPSFNGNVNTYDVIVGENESSVSISATAGAGAEVAHQ